MLTIYVKKISWVLFSHVLHFLHLNIAVIYGPRVLLPKATIEQSAFESYFIKNLLKLYKVNVYTLWSIAYNSSILSVLVSTADISWLRCSQASR